MPLQRSLLPPQPADYPFMRALDKAAREAIDIPILLADWVDIDTVDRSLLPYIGTLLGADLHTTALGERYERTTVKDSWLYHKWRGTKAGLDLFAQNAQIAWDYTIVYADGTRKPTGIDIRIYQQRAAEFSQSQLHYICRAFERLLPVHGVTSCALHQIYSGANYVPYMSLQAKHVVII